LELKRIKEETLQITRKF